MEQVLLLHARVVEETGGSHGVRDIGLLESAVARPQATFEGQELYLDIFSKAAALMDSLIRNHPFVDGKERTGVTSAAIFLGRDGWLLDVSNRELELFALQVARAELSISETSRWLREHCTPDLS
ncbi:MAG: type II toxin-antitoxin system death-on-curing family toxin [Anaerolineae bacterium]